MSIAVRKRLVSPSKYSIKAPYPMVAQFITIHNTANDATANGEVGYMIGNYSATGYHYAVDDKEVVQGIPTNRSAYHCGDGRYGAGNRKSIGVEICYSKSGGAKYKKAEALAIKFVAQLLYERGWGIDRVKPHQYWSGKFCPHRVLAIAGWDEMLDAINKELKALKGGKVTTAKAPVVSRGYMLKGDKGENVKDLQSMLKKAGYLKGAVDGIFGQQTEDAVKAMQKDNRIKVDGVAGQQTLQVLEALVAPEKITATYYGNGDSGAAVKAIQQQLKDLGYAITVDGHFGDRTEDDVKDFQRKNGLKVDGYVGSATMAMLKKKVSAVQADKKKQESEKVSNDVIGTLKVLVPKLNVRTEASFHAPVKKVVKKGETYKVYGQKNGLYHVGGGQYVTSNKQYVQFKKNPDYGTKKIEVLASQLFTYKTANWNNKGATVKKGEIFTVIKEVTVSGAKMYQLKSGAYITANPKYVKVLR